MTNNRLVFDCERMKYPFTGLYYFCLHLGKALLQQQPEGDELLLYLPPSVGATLFSEGVPVLQQHPLHKFSPPRTASYQLWHCTYQGSNYFPSSKKLKIVLTVHDLNFMHDEDKPDFKKKAYLKSLAKKVARADAIVAISEFVKTELLSYVNVPAQKIQVVYNGCNVSDDVKPVAPSNAPAKPFLFTIGTIVPKKNFHVLPAALLNNDYHLVIAGIVQDEAYLQKIKDKAEELGVSHRVHFAGAVTEAEKYWLLQNCSLFLFPSLAEGFGLPVIEAMYFGRPVLLSTKTSLPEIGGPHAGYLQTFDDGHIAEMCAKTIAVFTPEKGAASRAWARQFSWEAAAEAYWKIYKDIVHG